MSTLAIADLLRRAKTPVLMLACLLAGVVGMWAFTVARETYRDLAFLRAARMQAIEQMRQQKPVAPSDATPVQGR